MPRSLAFAYGLFLLVILTSACGLFTQAPQKHLDTAQTLLRCGGDGPLEGHEAASRALIEAARNDPTLLASDELIVAYRTRREGPLGLLAGPRDASAAVRAAHGLTLRRPLAAGRELVAATHPLDAAERLLDDPDVLYAHPNLALESHATERAPRYPVDDARQWNLSRFGLPHAWEVERGSPDVTIAVVDAGMDLGHSEFAHRLLPGWDFHGHDGDVDPGRSPGTNHGTHVAGIAAATGDGSGVSGVAPAGVRVLPIKVFDDGGHEASIVAVADAIRWAAGLDVRSEGRLEPAPLPTPVRVINLSLGTRDSFESVPELDAAIRDARRRGVIVVASVGNTYSTTGVTSPANSPCALAVSSVDESLERSPFSNHDARSRLVDLAAPGGTSSDGWGIYSTYYRGGLDDYGYLQGTSMAAPQVSAAIALLWSAHPEWSDVQVLERLLRTALVPAGGDPFELGFGVVCVDAALGADTRCGR